MIVCWKFKGLSSGLFRRFSVTITETFVHMHTNRQVFVQGNSRLFVRDIGLMAEDQQMSNRFRGLEATNFRGCGISRLLSPGCLLPGTGINNNIIISLSP